MYRYAKSTNCCYETQVANGYRCACDITKTTDHSEIIVCQSQVNGTWGSLSAQGHNTPATVCTFHDEGIVEPCARSRNTSLIAHMTLTTSLLLNFRTANIIDHYSELHKPAHRSAYCVPGEADAHVVTALDRRSSHARSSQLGACFDGMVSVLCQVRRLAVGSRYLGEFYMW
jgi:hypothetical protein